MALAILVKQLKLFSSGYHDVAAANPATFSRSTRPQAKRLCFDELGGVVSVAAAFPKQQTQR